MKKIRFIGFFCLMAIFSLAIILGNQFTGIAAKDNQCVECHTSAKKLIEITREIAKTRPAVKSENEGEG